MSKKLTPSKQVLDSSWNKHLSTPLIKGEIVKVVKTKKKELTKGYIKVEHGPDGSKAISTFNKSYFKKVKK